MVTDKQIWWDKESLAQHIVTQHFPFQIFIQLTYHVVVIPNWLCHVVLLYVVLSSYCPTIFAYVSPSILPLCLVITMTSSGSIVMVTSNIIQ